MRTSLLPRIAGLLLAVQLPVAIGAALLHDDDEPATEATTTDATANDDATTDAAADAERATFDRIAESADQTANATHYRFEMSMDIGAEGESLSVVLGRGERAGDRERFVMDQSDLMSGIGGVPDDVDLTMEFITDATTQYLRVPLFGFIADGAAAAGEVLPPFMEALSGLGNGWGRIDLGSLGAATGVPSDFMGQSSLDPATAVDMIRAAAGAEEQAGTGEVRGVAVTDYSVITTLEAMGGGMTAEDIAAFVPLPSEVDEGLSTDALDAMFDAPLDLTISLDDEGYVRRFVMDMGKLMAAMADEFGDDDMRGFTLTQTLEFFDYDDQSIVIDVPPIEETVDLTPWALELADAFS